MESEDMDKVNPVFQKPKEVKKKSSRRSSFYQRRLSSKMFDSPPTSTSTSIDFTFGSNENESCNSQCGEGESKITRRLNQIEKEMTDWNKLYQDLEDEYTTLEQHKSEVLHPAAWLTAEAKEFLGQRADMVEAGRLLDEVTEAVAVQRASLRASQRNITSLLHLNKQVMADITAKLIDRTLTHYDELNTLDVSEELKNMNMSAQELSEQ